MIDELEFYSMHLTYDDKGANAVVILLVEIYSINVIHICKKKLKISPGIRYKEQGGQCRGKGGGTQWRL